MIPQRDISRLANRLYEEARARLGDKAARRVPETTMERDYCLAWFLCGLAIHPLLSEALAFKGGTALRRIYFGEYRFSEDLDFTLTRELELDRMLQGFREVFAQVERESGVRISLAEGHGAVERHARNDTCYFEYQGPLPRSGRVKVDVTRGEVLVFALARMPVLQTYPEFDFPTDRPVQTYSTDEIIVEKVLALTDGARREPRDLYDLWHLIVHDLARHPELLVRGLSEKLASRPGRERDVLAPQLDRVERHLNRDWDRRLAAQVMALPEFEGCFREVRRLLVQFDEHRGP